MVSDSFRSTAPIRGNPGLPMAAGRLTSSCMPVVKAVVNSRPVLCLVDIASGCTMVSTQVAAGTMGKRSQHFVTADGRNSSGKECSIAVRLQGHSFIVNAIVVHGFENLDVDCLLGDDVVDHMGGVSVHRGSNSRYSVSSGKPSITECREVSSRRRREIASGGASTSLAIFDKDFEAKFGDGHWTVSWRW